jgi:hypothetical protein
MQTQISGFKKICSGKKNIFFLSLKDFKLRGDASQNIQLFKTLKFLTRILIIVFNNPDPKTKNIQSASGLTGTNNASNTRVWTVYGTLAATRPAFWASSSLAISS